MSGAARTDRVVSGSSTRLVAGTGTVQNRQTATAGSGAGGDPAGHHKFDLSRT